MIKYYKWLFLGLILAGALAFSMKSEAQLDPELKQTLLTTTDEAVLIKTIQKAGDSQDDIFMKNLACKRLAVYGTDAAIPALIPLLAHDVLNVYARYALEAMPGENVNVALRRAAVELKGKQAAGVIDTLGVRRDAGSIAMVKELLAKKPDPFVKKAIYVFLGNIANDETTDILLAELKGPKDENFTVWTGLADALLDCAEEYEMAGNNAKAASICDAIVNPSFPVFAQKAASYHALLLRKGDSAPVLLEKLQSPKTCCFTGGLKTIREYSKDDSEKIVKAVVNIFPKIAADRQARVLRALGDRTDEDSKRILLPLLQDLAAKDNISNDVQVALLAALCHFDTDAYSETGNVIVKIMETALKNKNTDMFAAFQKYGVQLKGNHVNETLVQYLDKVLAENMYKSDDEKVIQGVNCLLKVIELRRIDIAIPLLTKIAKAEGVKPEVRDAAIAALSEIVSLDKVGLMFDVLKTEADQKKIDWVLNATCTRLPREDCAGEVVKLFKAASTEDKLNLIPLLKQIGGKTALACIEEACWNADTVDKATEILGAWNTPDDIQQVAAVSLKLAKEATNNKYRIRGIRSYIRIPRQFNIPTEEKLAMCKQAFTIAFRPEDRTLIFDVFARIIDISAIEAALSYSTDSAYKDRACTAAVMVGEKINLPNDNSGKEARKKLCDNMQKVIDITGNADLKARAQKVIDRWK